MQKTWKKSWQVSWPGLYKHGQVSKRLKKCAVRLLVLFFNFTCYCLDTQQAWSNATKWGQTKLNFADEATNMSTTTVSATGHKCTASQRVLENADPLVLNKKARLAAQVCIPMYWSEIMRTKIFLVGIHIQVHQYGNCWRWGGRTCSPKQCTTQ